VGTLQKRYQDLLCDTKDDSGTSDGTHGRKVQLPRQVCLSIFPFAICLTMASVRLSTRVKSQNGGFGKNTNNEEWRYIARRIEKRDLDGKESETYISGRLISNKKIRKEVSRHAPPTFEQDRHSGNELPSLDYINGQLMTYKAPSPEPSEGILICTPLRGPTAAIESWHLPWFEFENLVEPQCM